MACGKVLFTKTLQPSARRMIPAGLHLVAGGKRLTRGREVEAGGGPGDGGQRTEARREGL